MKRFCILPLILCLFFSGCSRQESFEKPCSFYYLPGSVDTSSQPDIMVIQTVEGNHRTLEELMVLYLQGPSEEGMRAPFPEGTTVVELKQTDGIVFMTLSREISDLSGVELSLLCACLSKTCFAWTDAACIELRCESGKLDGKDSLHLEPKTFILTDTLASVSQNAENTQEEP